MNIKSTPLFCPCEPRNDRPHDACFPRRSSKTRKLADGSMLLMFCFLVVLPQSRAAAEATAATDGITVLNLGPHSRTVQTASGQIYQELACGLNYAIDPNQDVPQYLPSQEVISLVNGYGV